MSKLDFKNISKDDVIKAIDHFEKYSPDHKKPRNTFLRYKGKLYPAKAIRKLAYEIKNDTKISSEDLGGGRETARFFERLGFEVDYKPKHVDTHPKKRKVLKKEDLKIGLYNQRDSNKNLESFERLKELVKESDLDVLVFPEFCFLPFLEDFNNTDIYNRDERNKLVGQVLDLSKELETAVVVNSGDKNGFILTIYANDKAGEEDKVRFHFKHTYSGKSYFDFNGNEDFYGDQYDPVDLKGWKIGFSTCFDMLLPVLDKLKKQNGAEIVLNSTGGSVVRSKWINNLRTRAIENGLYYLVTMGEGSDTKTVITGATPEGLEMVGEEIGDKLSGSVKKFIIKKNTETRKFNDKTRESKNKKPDFRFDLGEIEKLKTDYDRIEEGVFVRDHNGTNIVFVLMSDEEIFKPDLILKKMLSAKLDAIPNKKFLLINRWERFDENKYQNQLLPVLRTRATENFCAVVFVSPDKKQGFQTTLNKYSQIIPIVDNKIDLDLKRMGGPETFWRNHGKPAKKWFKKFKENLD